MPAQKRAMPENLNERDDDCEDSLQEYYLKQSRHGREEAKEEKEEEEEEEEEANEEEEEANEEEEEEEAEEEDEEEEEEGGDSDGSQYSSSSDEKPEYTDIELLDVRKLVQCPICLGIIKKTRTVMECMHRFCRECIDKSMRLGNNECPACRTHCASRRSLRDDPRYDNLIAYLYEDINKYEEEELAFHEEEKTRNKQIQASIAQIVERQESLVRRRTPAKDSASGYMPRSQPNHRNTHPKRRRNYKDTELQASDDSEDDSGNGGSKDSSSAGEPCTEVKPRRYKRRAVIRPSQHTSSAPNPDGASSANHLELNRESRGISPGIGWKPEILAWGKGGTRSQTRHGGFSGSNSKIARSTHLTKLVDYLRRRVEENDDELDIHLMLVSLDKRNTPSLPQPFLCCHPSLPVKHLCEYVADQTPLRAEEVQMLVVKGHGNSDQPTDPSSSMDDPNPMPLEIDSCKDDLQILEGQETLGGLKAGCLSSTNYLILAYRQKIS